MLGITIDQLETTAVINVNQKCMIVYALYKNGEKKSPNKAPNISKLL